MTLKRNLILVSILVFIGLILGVERLLTSRNTTLAQAAQSDGRTQPDVLKLGLETKLGAVAFSHTNHTTKNYNVAGTGPINCVECHHVAQPASEVTKHPPLKTAWPADRTTTLTAETLKDPQSPPVVGCRGCHARADTKPTVLPAIPELKEEGSAAPIVLNNQQAFHRNCSVCHEQVNKDRGAKAPKKVQCTVCHKKSA